MRWAKRLFSAAIAAFICALCVSVPAFADSWKAVLMDIDDVLTQDQENDLLDYIRKTAEIAKCDVGVVITENIGGKSDRAYTEDMFDTAFGYDADGVMLLINNDYDSGFGDWIATGGSADRFGKNSDLVLSAVYDGLNSGGFYGAVIGYCDYLLGEEQGEAYSVVLSDLDDVLSSDEEAVLTTEMSETANSLEINIGVVITDDLGGKSDKQYADGFLDSSFGFGSSSVILLFNNDRSNMDYVDWISTCGKGSDWYDSKIKRIFDEVYDALGDDDYTSAILEFCEALEKYKGSGGSTYVDDPVSDHRYEGEFEFKFSLIPAIFGLVIAIIVTLIVSATYKRKVPISAEQYLDKSRTKYIFQTDNFVREYHTSHRVSSNSSGGGGRHGGGGGGHSRSHSSHGGGGGRRR